MLIIKNAAEIITASAYKRKPLAGNFFSECKIIKNGTVLASNGKIKALGKSKDILRNFSPDKKDKIIDASGKIVLPGFIDCHTHAVFAGSRAGEYQLKLAGAHYAEIHKKGGGIFSTVRVTRRTSEEDLAAEGLKYADRMFSLGTTTLEMKSGYGLDFKNEMKILRAIQKIRNSAKNTVISTFLGAHTIPAEFKARREAYVGEVIKKMIPYVVKNKLAEFCDVFCDPLGFTPEEAGRIFRAAASFGLKLRIHAEQTAHYGGAKVAAKFKALSAEHCDFMDDADILQLKKSGTIAVLLPGVLFHLMEWEKIRRFRMLVDKLRKAEVPIALATDFNPGSSPVLSLKIIMDLALRFFGLNYAECINAVTVNAALALGIAGGVGSLEPGKYADLLIVDRPSLKEYLHQPGDFPLANIIKKGDSSGV